MKNHSSFFLNYFSFFIKVLILFIVTFSLKADENNIGIVSEIKGEAVAINDDLEERDLNVFDSIFSNEEIFTTENSSITLQFNDDTTIIMKELTSLVVSEFQNSKLDPKFKSKVSKGKIVVETGLIAKNKTGEMEVIVKTSSLGLRGTRVNAALDLSGKLDVSLGEDNFGNVGQIKIINNGMPDIYKQQTIFSADEVFTISDYEIIKREKSTEEQNEEKISNEIFVNNSKINEEEIEIKLISKLTSGEINDVNNDGKVDTDDVEELKNQILDKKKQKIEFIIDNSKKENTRFLSSVIDGSDEKNTGEVLEKIIDTKDDLVEDVVEDLSDKDNQFLTTSNSKGASFIKEKIFENIVKNETGNSAAILSKVMNKSDIKTISSLINNITDKNKNEKSKLSLKVMANFSEKNPLKLENLTQNNPDQIEKLTISAVQEIGSSKEDTNLVAKIISDTSVELNNFIISEVVKNSIDDKQSLSSRVLNSVSEINSEKIETFSNENKTSIIDQMTKVAFDQDQGLIEEQEDMSNIVANIIMNTEKETSTEVLDSLGKFLKDSNSKLSLKVVVNLSKIENFENKLEIISEQSLIDSDNVEKLIEEAINSIDRDSEIEIVKNIIKESDKFLTKKIIEINKKSNQKEKLKIDKIIDKIIKEDPIKAKEIIEEKKKKETIKEIKKPKKIKEIKDVIDENISPN
ncbi:FecR domain-containing protein [Candidatus Pelagibacter sp.]|nr:FecR domain-containing protein [Candidatus Pelagibacter sp.]